MARRTAVSRMPVRRVPRLLGVLALHALLLAPRSSPAQRADSVAARVADAVCDREVVLLGELPTHGEARAFQAKAAIVDRLVERCGFDALLFADGRLHRAVQNIGGIANVTYLPPGGVPAAFDTGPGNVLLDEAVRLLSEGRDSFDRDGRLAARGSVDRTLLDEWLAHPFFHRPPPKSTGREQWGPAEAQRYVGQAHDRGLSDADTIATLTAFTAWSIAAAYRAYCGRVDEVIVAGGGVRNLALLALLREALPGIPVRPLDGFGLDADAKEAVAFALLGYAGLHGWPNNVPAATGAAHPVVLGSLTPGANYRALLGQVLQAPEEPPRALRIAGGALRVYPAAPESQ